MNDAERSGLSTMRDCWITGGVATSLAPAEWQQVVAGAEPDERERLLLAIAGQAFDVAFRPATPKTLTTRPALPRLDVPVVPEHLRPLFRSALKTADTRVKRWVLAVAEARGYVAHPFDWMPSASDVDAPRAYAPWVAWQAEASAKQAAPNALTLDTWDEHFPAARRAALADLRRTDPAAARTLLGSKAGAEPAEARLSLVEVLQVGLSVDDAPYLQTLLTDRSSKVKQLATRLLARIGQSQAGEGDPDAKELADFIEPRRTGILRGRTVYAPKKLNEAQATRRNLLFETVQLLDLAKALQISDQDLVAAWELGGKDGVDQRFTRMVGESGSDAVARTFGARLMETGDVISLGILLPRLDQAAGRRLLQIMLSSESGLLDQVPNIPGTEVSSFARKELMGSSLYGRQRGLLAERTDDKRLEAGLAFLGFLATPEAAQAIVADLTAAGLGPADPSLALLRLNVALAER